MCRLSKADFKLEPGVFDSIVVRNLAADGSTCASDGTGVLALNQMHTIQTRALLWVLWRCWGRVGRAFMYINTLVR